MLTSKLLSLWESSGIKTKTSLEPGSNYQIVDFDLLWFINIVEVMGGLMMVTGNGIVGSITLPADVPRGIHKKFAITGDMKGNLNIAEVGYIVFRNDETVVVPTLVEALAMIQDQKVGELA